MLHISTHIFINHGYIAWYINRIQYSLLPCRRICTKTLTGVRGGLRGRRRNRLVFRGRRGHPCLLVGWTPNLPGKSSSIEIAFVMQNLVGNIEVVFGPNGWMDQDATLYSPGHIALNRDPAASNRGAAPLFRPMSICCGQTVPRLRTLVLSEIMKHMIPVCVIALSKSHGCLPWILRT